MQGNQIRTDRNNQNRQFGLEQNKYDLMKTKQQEDFRRNDRDFAAGQADKANIILFDPDKKIKYSAEQIAHAEKMRSAAYSRFPELNPDYQQPEVPGETIPGNQTAAPGAPVSNQPVPEKQWDPTQLYDLQRQANDEQAAATAPPEFTKPFPPMGNPQFDFFGVQGIPNRPLANPGVGNIGTQNPVTAGSFPVDPRVPKQPEVAPPAPAPTQAQPGAAPAATQALPPAAPGTPEASVEFWAHEIKNAETPLQRQKAQKELQAVLESQAQIDLNRAQALKARVDAVFAAPLAEASIAKTNEDILTSQKERTTFRPRELGIKEQNNTLDFLAKLADAQERAAARGEAHTDAEKRLQVELARLGLDGRQFEAKLINDALQAGLTKAQIAKLKSEPDWRTKLWEETRAGVVGSNSYVKEWPSNDVKPGPTLGILNKESGGGQKIDWEGYLRKSPSSRQQKILQMKQWGIPVPGWFLNKK